jgi:hypothetical protein
VNQEVVLERYGVSLENREIPGAYDDAVSGTMMT